LILGPISALMGQNTFENTLIPSPQQFFAAGALRTFDTIIVQHNTTLIPAQAVPIIASLLNPSKKNFPRKEKINPVKRALYLDVGLVKFAEEGYDIQMREGRLRVRVSNYGGLFQAVVTLSQLLSANQSPDGFFLPVELKIKDRHRPKFNWRGMHLDVSRHFFPVSFVKKYIDILSWYKINRFHWHLTDDQGWRIEIKKYPRLTQIGGVRAETMTAKNFDPYIGDGKEHSGFYTQEEIRDVIEYARLRNIEIIPEIEMPGHARAALAAYPKLSCTGEKLPVPTTWGVFDDVYCNRESTFRFLFDVLDEVMVLFPSKVIHIGGDEVPKTRWNACSECQKIRTDHQLKDAHELQSYFIKRIDSFVSSRGKSIIGWDEILEGGLAQNAMVMSWRGTEGGIAAANMGHFVVMTPGSHCYFDHYQDTSGLEPLAIGGFTSLEKVYNYKPIPEGLSRDKQHFILGAQANMWTEYMATEAHVEYMLLPRICALSEVLWGTASDFTDFERRLQSHFEIFERNNWNYRK
jgi:hexosaminidase